MVTVSFFRFFGFKSKWWAFTGMVQHHAQLRKVKGLGFYKLMGTGGGAGFSSWPDFSTYCLLGVWKNERDYQNFLTTGISQELYTRASNTETFYLKPIQVRGTWGGIQPFSTNCDTATGDKIAVLTRARIRLSRQYEFWRNVPEVSRHILRAPGLKFARGIGEMPILEQATFSVWDSSQQMGQFAYHKKEHSEVIHKTRKRDWYSEELFVRFEVLNTEGEKIG